MTYTANFSDRRVMPNMSAMADFYASSPSKKSPNLSQFDIYALADNEPCENRGHESYALLSAREPRTSSYDLASLHDPANRSQINSHYNSDGVQAVIASHKGRFAPKKKDLCRRVELYYPQFG